MTLLTIPLIGAQLSPGDVTDWAQWIEKYGPWGVVGVIIACIVVLLAKKYVERVYRDWLQCLNELKTNVAAIKSTTEELKSIGEADREAFRTCVSSMNLVASEEHWKNCPVERCPNLTSILTRLNEIMDELQDFVREARETRERTRQDIQSIFQLIKEFSLEIIAVLRSQRNGRG